MLRRAVAAPAEIGRDLLLIETVDTVIVVRIASDEHRGPLGQTIRELRDVVGHAERRGQLHLHPERLAVRVVHGGHVDAAAIGHGEWQ